MSRPAPGLQPDAQAIRATARRVLETEAGALMQLAEELPDDFAATVALLLRARGRVILSGIGKSGHIARKIASTLASTGTPSYFVHPAEASHGDLGIVTPDDVCILLSNSGESPELADLIAHTRRFSIPLVGVSRRIDSTLMRAADLRLLLPDAPEACAIGMAPTTSTTLALALGDALAVALMEQRGFLRDQFRTLHPGGRLGAQLAQVHQLMHGDDALPLVAEDAPMSEVLIEMTAKGFGIAIVTGRDGRLAGVISDGDLRRNMHRLMACTAGQVATRTPKAIPPDMMAAEALEMMNAARIHALVVVDAGNAPIGVLRIHDCLRAGVA